MLLLVIRIVPRAGMIVLIEITIASRIFGPGFKIVTLMVIVIILVVRLNNFLVIVTRNPILLHVAWLVLFRVCVKILVVRMVSV